jgi:8-oxo-dGTP pyrophosphatase MutT (NUDIX family)
MKLLRHLTASIANGYIPGMTRQGPDELHIQTGALPWRLSSKNKVEVLLVTSRRSGRWTIPKGWPMRGKSLAEAAAREAFEEAGVTGPVDPKPIGRVNYVKNLLAIGELKVSIVVHRLRVDEELRKWPELGQRKRRWFSAKGAAKRVDSPELSELILQSLKKRSARERGSQ